MLFSNMQTEDIPHILTPEQARAELYLSIPAVVIPAIGEDNQESLDRQFDRAIGTRLFIAGNIDMDTYTDILHYTGVDVGNALDFWEQGVSLSVNFKGS